MDNIQELPYPVGTVLKEQEIYELCPRVEALRKMLKVKIDEKEPPDI